MTTAQQVLAAREREQLSEVERKMLAMSWKGFHQSAAGRDFNGLLDELAEGAHRAIIDCADYRESTELIIRYQQRWEVARTLRGYVQSQLKLWEEANGITDDNTGTDDNIDYAR